MSLFTSIKIPNQKAGFVKCLFQETITNFASCSILIFKMLPTFVRFLVVVGVQVFLLKTENCGELRTRAFLKITSLFATRSWKWASKCPSAFWNSVVLVPSGTEQTLLCLSWTKVAEEFQNRKQQNKKLKWCRFILILLLLKQTSKNNTYLTG